MNDENKRPQERNRPPARSGSGNSQRPGGGQKRPLNRPDGRPPAKIPPNGQKVQPPVKNGMRPRPKPNEEIRKKRPNSIIDAGVEASQDNKSVPKKKKRKQSKILLIIRRFFAIILTTLLSLFLIMIITGTIVATALTMYVLDYVEDSRGITFQELEQGYNTYFFAYDKEGNPVQLNMIKADVQRIPVTIDKIPQHVRDAFVYTEDERFYTHEGVDYKRTFSAFLNMFLHIYDTEQGGSTITQQLVKNLTGDKEVSPARKIREIFNAMQLEKTYSKDEILEQYLNYIGFGGPINGIELACIRYFGKSVDEINTAEAAVLAAIPKSPNKYGPFQSKTDDTGFMTLDCKYNNRQRQKYVLWQMYKNGSLTYDDYQMWLNEEILYTDTKEYLDAHPEDALKQMERESSVYSWAVDAAIYEVADYLMSIYNIPQYEAISRINKGGFQIYLTVDLELQEYLDEKFSDLKNLMEPKSVRRLVDLNDDGELEEDFPQVGFSIMDYEGRVLGYGGAIGVKEKNLVHNYATAEKRQVGSTMKPVSTYALAMRENVIHWGEMLPDKAVIDINGKPWPTNYSTDGHFSVTNNNIPVWLALQKSYNTIPAYLCKKMTPKAVYDFCTEEMGLELDPKDQDLSPLSVGGLTYGISVQNLTNAFMVFGNGGTRYDAHVVSRITTGNNKPFYENNGNPRQVLDGQSAWVMNRLLKNIVDRGTGTAAKLSNKEVCGKTGTTNDWKDLLFVGLTEDFVSGVWMGYKRPAKFNNPPKSAKVWYNIIGEYANKMSKGHGFPADPAVITGATCAVSGKIASSGCPKELTGYWKSSNAPVCTGGHVAKPAEPQEGAEGAGTGGGGGAVPVTPPAD